MKREIILFIVVGLALFFLYKQSPGSSGLSVRFFDKENNEIFSTTVPADAVTMTFAISGTNTGPSRIGGIDLDDATLQVPGLSPDSLFRTYFPSVPLETLEIGESKQLWESIVLDVDIFRAMQETSAYPTQPIEYCAYVSGRSGILKADPYPSCLDLDFRKFVKFRTDDLFYRGNIAFSTSCGANMLSAVFVSTGSDGGTDINCERFQDFTIIPPFDVPCEGYASDCKAYISNGQFWDIMICTEERDEWREFEFEPSSIDLSLTPKDPTKEVLC